MNYDRDEDTGKLIRICTPCLDEVETDYILEEDHETTRCIYCDSADTRELAPNWKHYVCNTCGEKFVVW
jgi:DNA-directed RNA polymerase subunit RPC12/RpoP